MRYREGGTHMVLFAVLSKVVIVVVARDDRLVPSMLLTAQMPVNVSKLRLLHLCHRQTRKETGGYSCVLVGV